MLKALKIGLVLVIVGIVATVGGFLISGDSGISAFPQQNYEKVDEFFDVGSITKLDVKMENRKIVINRNASETGKIEISYYESENDRIDSLVEGSTLSIENFEDWYDNLLWWTRWMFWGGEKQIVYINLPAGTTFDLTLDTENGDLNVLNLTNLGELDLNTENGDIDLSGLNLTGNLTLDTENGDIEVQNVVFVNGELSTTNGEIDLMQVTAESINATDVNGGISFTEVTTTGSLVLDTVNGSIDITRGTIALFPGSGTPRETALSCSTENGAISIDVYGTYEDYFCNFKSVTGAVYVNSETEGEGNHHESQHSAILLQTTNGSINLDFLS